ncbi:MAG: YciI family protein [Streptosporangiales bacterium]
MKYALLIYGNEQGYANLSEEEGKKLYAEHAAFGEKLGDHALGGEELRPSTTATSVRWQGAEALVTDGPYAETTEQLGGFYLVEATDLDEAIGFAKELPTISGDVVEVRPVA